MPIQIKLLSIMSISDIPGLYYIPNYLTSEEVKKIKLSLSKSKSWQKVNLNYRGSRRVIHKGYSYSYNRSGVKKLDSIPNFYQNLVSKDRLNTSINVICGENNIFNDELDGNFLDQLIVNEYIPGQGIAAHIDHPKYFGDFIVCLTVGGGTTVEFTKGSITKSVYIEEGSLYIMSGDARYKWKHEIKKQRSDNGIPRKTRYSLTYRIVNDEFK